MDQLAFNRWLLEGGQVVVPFQLLEKMQVMNLTPENMSFLVLGLAYCQQNLPVDELSRNRWVKWCLAEGWAVWEGQSPRKKISFRPLWNRLYALWEESARERRPDTEAKPMGEFNYARVLKWLDQERGTLSATLREKQVIQEFNLKYGWSSDFILIFLQLAFERGLNQVQNYQPVARRAYESGIDTVEGLISFMNDLDWIQYKVAELKKCIGQYGGVTKPQREMYLKWHRQWDFGHELIMRAAEETVRTNNPSFKYIDAVLKDWHEKGVQDVRDAEKVIADHDSKESRDGKEAYPNKNKKRIRRLDHRDWENI